MGFNHLLINLEIVQTDRKPLSMPQNMLLGLFLIIITWCTFAHQYHGLTNNVYVVTLSNYSESNDLIETINSTFRDSNKNPIISFQFCNNISSTVESAPNGAVIFYLGTLLSTNGYPNMFNPISNNDYQVIVDKSIKIYIEYPSCALYYTNSTNIECTIITQENEAQYERSVMISNNINDNYNGNDNSIQNLSIIDLHLAHWGLLPPVETSFLFFPQQQHEKLHLEKQERKQKQQKQQKQDMIMHHLE